MECSVNRRTPPVRNQGILAEKVPASFFLGIWFLFQLWDGGFSLAQPQAGGGIAFFAHVGGFLFGALTVSLFKQRQPLRPRW